MLTILAPLDPVILRILASHTLHTGVGKEGLDFLKPNGTLLSIMPRKINHNLEHTFYFLGVNILLEKNNTTLSLLYVKNIQSDLYLLFILFSQHCEINSIFRSILQMNKLKNV